ncbi:hypothetical protein C8F01DRAFT_1164947, partial [Mycena amicta]
MAEPGTSNAADLPVVPMSIPAFCDWIDSDKAPASLADTVVSDISWWCEKDSVLHHQFVLLRIRHEGTNGQSRSYHLRLERAGKRSGDPLALDMVTFLPDGLDEPCFSKNQFFCALGSEEYMRPLAPLVEGPGMTPPTLKAFAGADCFLAVLPAFQDFLDHKWRGRPPTLRDVALRWSMTGEWFLGNFGHPLYEGRPWQQRRNGSLLFRRTIRIFIGIIALAVLVIVVIVGFTWWFKPLFKTKTPSFNFNKILVVIIVLPNLALVGVFLAVPGSWLLESVLHRYIARKNMRAIVQELDKEDRPERRRGDFLSPDKIGITLQTERHTRVLSWTRRVLPEPWERDEQIYAPAKEEYFVALEQMRQHPDG